MAHLKDLIVDGAARFIGTIYGNLSGNASTATKLQTARKITAALDTSGGSNFDGSADVNIGVSGTLPLANGGTGATTAAGAKSNIGLSNVTNYDSSIAIKNITRSGLTFTATRVNGGTFTFTQQDTTYGDASTSGHGLMTAAMVTKLNGIAAGAQVNSVTSVAGKTGAVTLSKSDVGLGNVDNINQSKAIKGITRSGTTFTYTCLDGSTGTFTQQDNNTTYGNYKCATSTAAGAAGLVPAPDSGYTGGHIRFLRSDTGWTKSPFDWGQQSGNGEYNYVKLATITIISGYVNRSLTFEISGRGFNTSNVHILFASTDSMDPGLQSFTATGWMNFWLAKTATSTWCLYGQYNEIFGDMMINRIFGAALESNNVSITTNLTNVDSVPSGATKAGYENSVSYAVSAGSASKLSTARNIKLTGDVSGSASFNGTADANITATVADDSHNHSMLSATDLTDKTQDLNDLTLNGASAPYTKLYIEKTTGGASKITNLPEAANPFVLIVQAFRYATNIDYICSQKYFSAVTHKEYTRYYTINGTSGSWSGWTQNYTTENKPSKSDVGLGNVDNTADANKSVKYATSAGSASSATSASKADQLTTARTIGIGGAVTGTATSFNGTSNITINTTAVDATKLTGTIDIARLPAGALERCVVVADDTARFKLTEADVQTGDTVKVISTGLVYLVTDTGNLANANGYTVYTAGSATSVPWSGVSGKPSLVNSVAGRSGAVTLSKSDVGLGNVDNTADANKSVKYATTAGSANSVAYSNVSGRPTFSLSGTTLTINA